MQSVAANQNKYERVFINNTAEPSLLHYLFWTKYDPAKFQQDFKSDIPQDKIYKDFNGFKFGEKIYFGEVVGEPFNFLEKGDLYLAAQGKEIPGDWDLGKNPPENIKTLNISRNPKGLPIYSLITKNEK